MWWAPNFMTENGLFVLGGPETQLHDILWAIHECCGFVTADVLEKGLSRGAIATG